MIQPMGIREPGEVADHATLRLVQRIYEEQGFLLVCGLGSPEVGSIVAFITIGPRRLRIPGPMVVIGSATREEWEAQRAKYSGISTRPVVEGLEFCKVVAE
jgi:hypothetical protein